MIHLSISPAPMLCVLAILLALAPSSPVSAKHVGLDAGGNLIIAPAEGKDVVIDRVVFQELVGRLARLEAWKETVHDLVCVSFFQPFQEIAAPGANTWEAFVIGSTTYLAVANHQNDQTHNVKSRIYTFNLATQRFELFQEIDTSGALDWETLVIGNTTYLTVANYNNGQTRNIKSRIYHFNPAAQRFELFQEIDTSGAVDWEAFVIGNTTYLAVANHNNDKANNVKSRVFTFSPAAQRFELLQEIDTSGAVDWEAFVIGDTTYLAVANWNDGQTNNIKSRIYAFSPAAQRFELFQEIDTIGAHDWEAFVIGSTTYLAMANHFNGQTYNLNSQIYAFSPVTKRFQPFQEIETSAVDWEAFVIGNSTYLAAAYISDGQTYNVKSRIYRAHPIC